MKVFKNIVIILAGGVGSRFGGDKPKQFVKLSGKTVFEHTLSVFDEHSLIDEIIVVCKREYITNIEEMLNNHTKTKVTNIISGGEKRSDSTQSALSCIKSKYGESNLDRIKILIHDSVRPFVSAEIISNCLKELDKNNAVDVAIPCTDTIIKVSNSYIDEIPDRNDLYQGQTPQGFIFSTLLSAYELMEKSPSFSATDDCGVVKEFLPNTSIKIVKGDCNNIKITNPNDIQISDILFQLNQREISDKWIKIEDFKNKVIVVFGGSYGIGKSIVDKLNEYGAITYSFSRSEKGCVTDTAAVDSFLREIYRENERIDSIVNVVGSLNKKPLIRTSEEELRKGIDVNLFANFSIAKLSFEYLKESKGSLILFSSSSYTRGRAYYSIYSATKAAVVNLTQALSEEWSYHGIRVNCITPDRTKTPMRVKNFGVECDSTLLSPEKVADVTLSAMFKNVTGVNFRCRL